MFNLSITVCEIFFCLLRAKENLGFGISKLTVVRNNLTRPSLKPTKRIYLWHVVSGSSEKELLLSGSELEHLYIWEIFPVIHQSGNCLEIQVTKDFPHGPGVKNVPCSAGRVGSIPGRGTKIPHEAEQLSPYTRTREPMCHNYWACVLKLESPVCCNSRFCVLQLRPNAAQYLKYFQKKRKEKVQVTNLIPISMWENVDSVLLCWGYLNEGCCFHHETCINNCGLREGKEYKKKKKS